MKKNKFYIEVLSLFIFGLAYNSSLFSHHLEEAVESMDQKMYQEISIEIHMKH